MQPSHLHFKQFFLSPQIGSGDEKDEAVLINIECRQSIIRGNEEIGIKARWVDLEWIIYFQYCMHTYTFMVEDDVLCLGEIFFKFFGLLKFLFFTCAFINYVIIWAKLYQSSDFYHKTFLLLLILLIQRNPT